MDQSNGSNNPNVEPNSDLDIVELTCDTCGESFFLTTDEIAAGADQETCTECLEALDYDESDADVDEDEDEEFDEDEDEEEVEP